MLYCLIFWCVQFRHIFSQNICPLLPIMVWTQALKRLYDLAPPTPPSSLPPLPIYISLERGCGRSQSKIMVLQIKKYFIRQSGANNTHLITYRGGHRHFQIGRMPAIDLISKPPPTPPPQMYVSKVWESVWPEGAGSDP